MGLLFFFWFITFLVIMNFIIKHSHLILLSFLVFSFLVWLLLLFKLYYPSSTFLIFIINTLQSFSLNLDICFGHFHPDKMRSQKPSLIWQNLFPKLTGLNFFFANENLLYNIVGLVCCPVGKFNRLPFSIKLLRQIVYLCESVEQIARAHFEQDTQYMANTLFW